MNMNGKKAKFLDMIKEVIERDQEVLFAYLYGSFVYADLLGSDIDLAVYLKSADIKACIRKEEELTSDLTIKLHTGKIDLRILNVLPLLLQYNILKEGIRLFVRDERERVDFETRVMERFFELKPYLDEYKQMLSLRIEEGV
jgi:predicted nucleotidyltransferase